MQALTGNCRILEAFDIKPDRDLRSAPGMVLGQMLNHVGIPTTSDTCSRAVEEAWAARSELRFNKGVESRAGTYFSPRHLEQLADMLSFHPALRFWSNDLLGLA